MSAQNLERICELNVHLTSPLEVDDSLFIVAQNGEIYKLKEGQLKTEFKFGGQPCSIAIDKVAKTIFVADLANQAILAKQMDEKSDEAIPELVKDFEGSPLLGPNSIVFSSTSNHLYFTDSGPFGETSIESPKGSVFMIDIDAQFIRPLALNCLAYPSGIVLSQDEKIIYVSETKKNRILRFVSSNQGVYFFSIFHQFSGRFGPTAIATSHSDLIYVARYEFSVVSSDGMITVLNNNGDFIDNIMIPGAPEINGLSFSKIKPNFLFITENSSQPCCIRLVVAREDKDKDEKKIKAEI